MLAEERFKQLRELVSNSTKEELIWINGYLSGLVSVVPSNGNGHETTVIANETQKIITAVKKITLAFGTETGNARRLATHLAAVAKKKGIIVKLSGLDQYRLSDLPKEEYFFVVISTQGEGEPPVGAKKFYDHIHGQELSLGSLKYSVLALGDSSYPLFCKTGEDVDGQLHKFGAHRLVPLQKCDVDYEEDAQQWFEEVLKKLEQQEDSAVTSPALKPIAKKTAGKKYYSGTILSNINLNDRGSHKKTFHIEIDAGEPIQYEPGDSIGIIPQNRQDVVDRIISLTRVDANSVVETTKVTGTVRELLTKHLNICYLLGTTVKKYAAVTGQEIPDTRMDLVDLLRIYPVGNADQFPEIVKILMPISPRLYSIASSPAAHGANEVHITVARDKFLAQDEQRFGLCSDFLGDLPVDAAITFYVHKHKHFKLPSLETDIIMIGPGTGIAPFRSFLSERDASGATGRNWLFFGEQHFTTDFLYQTEIQNFFSTGVLNRISLAFSRDQAEKIYVQRRMLEEATELYAWMSQGAFVYVSGTKDPMSVDVENTLLRIIEEQGKASSEEAKAFLENMKKENRYEKDVY